MTERFILIGCLLQGALCSDSKHWPAWKAQMPQNIQALHGSCVLIPCTFEIPSYYDQYLINPVGIWKRNDKYGNAVFSSNEKLKNDIQGEMIGNLSEKNCTTVLNDITKDKTDDYFFRIDCNNRLKYTYIKEVKLDVRDSPPSPQITIKKKKVKEEDPVPLKEGDSVTLEGDSVTLTCSAPAPCPSLPPTLSWTPRLSESITVFQENDDHTKHVSSVMTFTASHLLHKQEVKCTAVYRLQADNSERTSHTNVTLKVLYSPKNTSVLIRNDWSLTCSSDANPAVNNYTWYKVTGSEIKVVSNSQNLTCNITKVSGQYYCQAENKLGLQNSSTVNLDSEYSPPSPQITINKDMVKEGDSVNLTCLAPALCPSLPPTLSWTPRLNDSITVFQENDNHTKHESSVMTFTASHLLHKQEVKCTAVYRLQPDNSERTSHTNITLNVQYSPKNTSVLIGKDRSLTCNSDANPAVNNYTWYKVTGSEIKVLSDTQSLTSNMTVGTDSGQYYCQAQNEHGLQNSSTVQVHCESVKAPPTLIGAAAGAAGMILTCILLMVILRKSCTRQNHGSKIQETGELTPTNQCENDGPELLYANIDHSAWTEQGTGTIQGSSQKTEYAEVKLGTRKELEGTDMTSEVQEEEEQDSDVLGVSPGPSVKRKETQKPESGYVSGCGSRAQDSTETQKRKTELRVEQETMEDRKSSVPDDQLNTPEPKEEATYGNICHQLGTKGPDKRSAAVEASGNKQQSDANKDQQDHHAAMFYPLISAEKGTNESEYAVVRKF